LGLNIEIHDERGKVLELVTDENNLVMRIAGKTSFEVSPMLASLDPYGNTIFNRIQIPQFLSELSARRKESTADDEITLANKVVRLAETVCDSVHLYLAFIGD
jgi:hypothetical protein